MTGQTTGHEALIGRCVHVYSDTGGVGYIAYIRAIEEDPEEGIIEMMLSASPPNADPVWKPS